MVYLSSTPVGVPITCISNPWWVKLLTWWVPLGNHTVSSDSLLVESFSLYGETCYARGPAFFAVNQILQCQARQDFISISSSSNWMHELLNTALRCSNTDMHPKCQHTDVISIVRRRKRVFWAWRGSASIREPMPMVSAASTARRIG